MICLSGGGEVRREVYKEDGEITVRSENRRANQWGRGRGVNVLEIERGLANHIAERRRLRETSVKGRSLRF